MSILVCPQCNMWNDAPAQFCNNCGDAFAVQPKKASNFQTLLLLLLIPIITMCIVVGINSIKQADAQPTQSDLSNLNVPLPASKPSLTDAEKLRKAKIIIESNADNQEIDNAVNLIKTIPKNAKQYSEGQKLYNKAVYTITERAVIGAKPVNNGFDGGVSAVKSYLSATLNDYDSSEFLEWSDVTKVYVRKEPFWAVRLKLRAKNAFGAYIVKDVVFYIRQNQVVSSRGL